jgi:hypothetical protein
MTVQTHGSAYYRERMTGGFLRVTNTEVPNSRLGENVGKVYRCRVYYEGTNSLSPDEIVSEKYLKDRCVYYKAQFVPDGIRNMLNMGW